MRRGRLTRYREALGGLGPLPVAAVLERLEAEGQLAPGWESGAAAALARPEVPWPARVFIELGSWGAVALLVFGLAGDDLLHASGAEKLCGLLLCAAGIAIARIRGRLLAGALARALITIGQLLFFIGVADLAAHVVPELCESALVLELALLLAAEDFFQRLLSATLLTGAAIGLAEWLTPGSGDTVASIALLLGLFALGHQDWLQSTRLGPWLRPVLVGTFFPALVTLAWLPVADGTAAFLSAVALALAVVPAFSLRPAPACALLATAAACAFNLPHAVLLATGLSVAIAGAHRRFPVALFLGVLAAAGGAFQLELAESGSIAGLTLAACALGLLLLRIGVGPEPRSGPSVAPAVSRSEPR